MRIGKEQEEKARNLEEKASQKIKAVHDMKGLLVQEYKNQSIKNNIKKKYQERKINQLKEQFQRNRLKIIDKIKESDSQTRSRGDLDVQQLKVKLESQLRSEII